MKIILDVSVEEYNFLKDIVVDVLNTCHSHYRCLLDECEIQSELDDISALDKTHELLIDTGRDLDMCRNILENLGVSAGDLI